MCVQRESLKFATCRTRNEKKKINLTKKNVIILSANLECIWMREFPSEFSFYLFFYFFCDHLKNRKHLCTVCFHNSLVVRAIERHKKKSKTNQLPIFIVVEQLFVDFKNVPFFSFSNETFWLTSIGVTWIRNWHRLGATARCAIYLSKIYNKQIEVL